MKRTIITIIAAAVAMVAVSCNKEISNPQAPCGETLDNTVGKTLDISVNALMPEYSADTKSGLVNTMRVSWKKGDVIYVYDGTQYLGSLVASLDGNEDRYALLSTDDSHTVKEPAAGTDVLTLVYSPLLTKAPAVAGNAVSVSLAAQNTPKAPFVVYATLDYSGTSIADAIVPFRFATSVIRVNCTGLNANTAITSATLSNVNTVCKLSLSGTTAPTVTGETNGILTRTGDTYFAAAEVNGEGEAVFQIAVPALEASSEARVLTVKQKVLNFICNDFTKKSLGAATSVNTVCQFKTKIPDGMLPGKFSVSATRKVHFSQGNLYYDGKNWGFEKEQYEFHGYDSSKKTWGLFGWSTSATNYGMSTSSADTDYSGEFIDWGTAIDDNGTWTTLSGGYFGEWKYLFDNHINVWGTCNDVPGYFIAPDGWVGDATTLLTVVGDWESAQADGIIFLPAAGYRIGIMVYDIGNYGIYWTSSPFGDYEACNAGFNSGEILLDSWHHRLFGFSVRLVTDVE